MAPFILVKLPPKLIFDAQRKKKAQLSSVSRGLVEGHGYVAQQRQKVLTIWVAVLSSTTLVCFNFPVLFSLRTGNYAAVPGKRC